MIIHHKSFKILVRLERFELPAYRFVACCSIQLSYSRPGSVKRFLGNSREKNLSCAERNIFFTIISCYYLFLSS